MRVDDVMSCPVISVSPTTTLDEVAALLAEHAISGVPVVERNRLVGVVSESDIARAERVPEGERPRPFARLRRHTRTIFAREVTAGEVMSSPTVTVEPWASVAWAAWLFVEHDVNRLPVVQHDRLVGIVARADLVRALARSDAEIERDILERVLPSLVPSPHLISVTVQQGEVELEGELQSAAELDALSAAVKEVPGVVLVRTDLRVSIPQDVGTPV